METLLEDVENGRVEKVATYLESSACDHGDVLSEVEGLESLLHIAVSKDNEAMVDLLLHYDTLVVATNLYGETPLHIACRHGKSDYVKKLLAHGADIDHKDSAECSPLFHAVNHVAVVKILIDAGCDLDTLNEELITPLDYAILHNKKEVISLLLKAGCAIDRLEGHISHPDYWAYSILFPLWRNCDITNIQLLIDCGYTSEFSYIRTMLELLQKHCEVNGKNLQMLKSLTDQPQSLVSLCRICIRRVFHARRTLTGESVDAMVTKLNLPQKLKNYLKICD